MVWLSIGLTTTLGGIVQTVTGFGGGVVLMLLLPYYFDMVTAPALSAAINLGLSGALMWKFRRHFEYKLALSPCIAYLICSISVIHIAQRMDMEVLSLAFGVFLVILALYFFLFSERVHFGANWRTGLVCGGISGATSGLFGIGGPLMAIYFVSGSKSKESYIANIQGLFTITGIINLLTRISRGIYTLELVPLTLLGFAAIYLGQVIGLKIVKKLNADILRKLIYAFVGISGILTIWQHL